MKRVFRKRSVRPRVVTTIAKALGSGRVSYGGYLPLCPHCRQPLSEDDVRRFNIGLAANDTVETLGAQPCPDAPPRPATVGATDKPAPAARASSPPAGRSARDVASG